MGVDIHIHAARVILELLAVARREKADSSFGKCTESQNSLLAVVLQRSVANDFGEFAAGSTPEYIHLKQAVLRRDIALGHKKISEARRFQRGYAVLVASDADGCRKAHDVNRSIEGRQR